MNNLSFFLRVKIYLNVIFFLFSSNMIGQIAEISIRKELNDVFYYSGDLVLVFHDKIRIYDINNFEVVTEIDCNCNSNEETKISGFYHLDEYDCYLRYSCNSRNGAERYYIYNSNQIEKHQEISKREFRKRGQRHFFEHPIFEHKKVVTEGGEEVSYYILAEAEHLRILKFSKSKLPYTGRVYYNNKITSMPNSGHRKTFSITQDEDFENARILNKFSPTNEKIETTILARNLSKKEDLVIVVTKTKVLVFSLEQLIDQSRISDINRDKSDSKIFAVCVGLEEYKNSDRLGSLPSVAKYVSDFNWYLTAKGFIDNEENPVMLNSQADRNSIIRSLRQNFVENIDVTANDFVIFYFSGHGVLAGNSLGICPYDYYSLKDVITQEDIISILEESPARHKLVIIEACKVEVTADFMPTTQKNQFNSERNKFTGGIFFLTSTQRGEYSVINPEIGAVFSYFLIKGIKDNAANLNNDDYITIGELTSYLQKEVSDFTNGDQVPELLKNEIDLNTPIFITN